MKLPTLESVLQYENPAVLKLYIQNYPENKLSADTAFKEMLKYLWLSQKHSIDSMNRINDIPPRCAMLRSMREIDEMWHEFILFTKDYSKFCDKYFGRYMHHLPNIFDNAPVSPEEQGKEIDQLLPYIYENLGEDTMRVWFADYLDTE